MIKTSDSHSIIQCQTGCVQWSSPSVMDEHLCGKHKASRFTGFRRRQPTFAASFSPLVLSLLQRCISFTVEINLAVYDIEMYSMVSGRQEGRLTDRQIERHAGKQVDRYSGRQKSRKNYRPVENKTYKHP